MVKTNDRTFALKVPKLEELFYRQQLLADPATMSYNRGYQLDDRFYDNETGCIDFPPERWAEWHQRWIGQEPARFYAYPVWEGQPIGEVSMRQLDEPGVYEIGVVIEHRRRGKDFGRRSLELLLEKAFGGMSAKKLCNTFERSRQSALRIHEAAGFRIVGECGGMVSLELTREEYEARKAYDR